MDMENNHDDGYNNGDDIEDDNSEKPAHSYNLKS